ncbi:MAG: hypothetical protein EXR50_05860 [Dehalococcoidia bacterium]|nr:hypothetical protein [Dehalococcoidia bacterium]
MLAEMVKSAPSRGESAVLSIQRFSVDGPIPVLSRRWANLAAYEAQLQRNRSDSGFRPAQDKIALLTTRPTKQELFEELVPVAPGTVRGLYTNRTSYYPALDKIGELRALLEERVKSASSRGVSQSLSAQRFSSEGPVYVLVSGSPDLATFEATNDRNRAGTADFGRKAAALVRQPNKQELFETLAPRR